VEAFSWTAAESPAVFTEAGVESGATEEMAGFGAAALTSDQP
jgi:hypothetical protein